jgi:hypothetical protein
MNLSLEQSQGIVRVCCFILLLTIVTGCRGGEETKRNCLEFCIAPECTDFMHTSIKDTSDSIPLIKLQPGPGEFHSDPNVIQIPDSLVNTVRLDFYNVVGQQVSVVTQICLLSSPVNVSLYDCIGRNSSGLYIVRLSRNDTLMATAKVVYLK